MITSSLNANSQSNLKKSDFLVFPLYESSKWPELLTELDDNHQRCLSTLVKQQEFKAKSGEALLCHFSSPAVQVLLVGLGRQNEESQAWLACGALATRKAAALKIKSAEIILEESFSARQLYSCALGLQISTYRFEVHKKEKSKTPKQSWSIVTSMDKKAANALLKRSSINAQSISKARDLVNQPGNVMTPQALASHARGIAKTNNLKIKVLNKAFCEKQKMNLFLSVGAGSTANPPLFIHMSYSPKGKTNKRKVYLIGKGVTFDSGGLSLKPGGSMMEMKMDMAGSAAVISAMESIAKLKPNCEVHAIVAATENMPDGDSTRPGDVIVAKDGTSVEILNTDAEGRLTLADAITYSRECGATEIIDLATLTGACIVALGPNTAALYSDHEEVCHGLLHAAKTSHESLWHMPLTKEYNKMLKSPVADLKNIGDSYGGSITAALFLQHFSGDTPWAHLDIAGPAYSKADEGPLTKGGTGYGVHTLVEYLCPLEG